MNSARIRLANLRPRHWGCKNLYRSYLSAVVLFSFGLSLAFAQTPKVADSVGLIIRDVSVFDVQTGNMSPQQTIVIEGKRIKYLGSSAGAPAAPPDATVIDGHGKYAIPGLIDAHVHLVHVFDFAHITGSEILPMFLASGVTSLRDTGDEIVAEKLIAKYAEDHAGSSPRVFLSSPFIDGKPPFHEDNGVSWGVTDPKEVSAFVEDMAGWGVITLKLYVGTQRPVGQKVIEEARRRGMVVTGHLYKYSAQEAVADGIDALEHIESVFNYMFPPDAPHLPDAKEEMNMTAEELHALHMRIEESRANLDLGNPTGRALIESLVQRKVFVDPTLVVFRNMIFLPDLPEVNQNSDNAPMPIRLKKFWPGYGPRVSPETQDLRRRQLKKYQELTGLLYRAGVPLLCGTDTPEPYVPPGASMHQELELLVESGLPPAAAIQAATINVARSVKQESELGSIEVGKLADIVLLNANPLSDIKNTRAISAVIHEGIIAEPKSLLQMVPAN